MEPFARCVPDGRVAPYYVGLRACFRAAGKRLKQWEEVNTVLLRVIVVVMSSIALDADWAKRSTAGRRSTR